MKSQLFLGAVTDLDGTPLAGASVEVDYIDFHGNGQWRTVNTTSAGRYSLHVPARPHSQVHGVPNTLGIICSGLSGYDFNVQLVGGNATQNEINFRLHRRRVIEAGASIAIALERHSSLCTDFDNVFKFDARCEYVYVKTATDGILTVTASPVSSNGIVPFICCTGPWVAARDSVLRVQAKAGGQYAIRFEMPISAAPQQLEVTTALEK